MCYPMVMRFFVVALFAAFACGHDAPPPESPADHPPLPSASGTPIGFLIDASGELKLRDDQLKELKELDASLAARDAEVDTQLRMVERPEQAEKLSPQEVKAGVRPQHYNNAPGASVIPNRDADKLRAIRADNDRLAVDRAWTILDKEQQPIAQRILQDRGVQAPGATKPAARDGSDGQPLPGMEP